MWLRLLLQLREYLPHLVRLVPLLENVVATRLTAPPPQQIDLTPLAEISENLKADLSQVATSHLALSKQIYENHEQLSMQLTSLSREMTAHRASADQRIQALEDHLRGYRNWFWALLTLLFIVIALLIALLVVK